MEDVYSIEALFAEDPVAATNAVIAEAAAIGEIEAKLRRPHLIPDEARTSPTALAHSIEDVYKLVRGRLRRQIRERPGGRSRQAMATSRGSTDDSRGGVGD
jgi:hypothetical protein